MDKEANRFRRYSKAELMVALEVLDGAIVVDRSEWPKDELIGAAKTVGIYGPGGFAGVKIKATSYSKGALLLALEVLDGEDVAERSAYTRKALVTEIEAWVSAQRREAARVAARDAHEA